MVEGNAYRLTFMLLTLDMRLVQVCRNELPRNGCGNIHALQKSLMMNPSSTNKVSKAKYASLTRVTKMKENLTLSYIAVL